MDMPVFSTVSSCGWLLADVARFVASAPEARSWHTRSQAEWKRPAPLCSLFRGKPYRLVRTTQADVASGTRPTMAAERDDAGTGGAAPDRALNGERQAALRV